MSNKSNLIATKEYQKFITSSSQLSNRSDYNDLTQFGNIYQHLTATGNASNSSSESGIGLMLSPTDFVEFQYKRKPRVIHKSRNNNLHFQLRNISNFKIMEIVGEGSYGKVYKAMDLLTSRFVALKLLRMEHESEGFPITCIREIVILRRLNHENIMKLNDIVFDVRKKSTFLVFDYMNNDLCGLLHNKEMIFNENNIYQITRQLLNGLHYCHTQEQVVHRDLKTSNILINSRGQVKIADFGMARFWEPNRPFTNKVVTLWYRPIELLMGQEIYDFSADIWSLGCIICEMFQRAPLFPHNDEFSMITAVFNLCGTPEFNGWDTTKLKTKIIPKPRPRIFKRTLSGYIPSLALDLIDKMLALDPSKRITAHGALKSDWILYMQCKRLPPMQLPRYDSFEMRMRKHHHRRF